MNKHNPIVNAVRSQLNWTQYMNSPLLQNGTTPTGSQVCSKWDILQTGVSGGILQLRETENGGRSNGKEFGGVKNE